VRYVRRTTKSSGFRFRVLAVSAAGLRDTLKEVTPGRAPSEARERRRTAWFGLLIPVMLALPIGTPAQLTTMRPNAAAGFRYTDEG
jgi:hypothetical protein